MEEWQIAGVAILCNVALWLIMFGIQQWESYTGRIPRRSTAFPYIQDFWTSGPLGDLVALSCIDAVAAIGIAKYGFQPWMILVLLGAGFVTRVFYQNATSKNRSREDIGYRWKNDRWSPTYTGAFHIPYFFLQVGAAILASLFVIIGRTPILWILFLLGASLYGFAAMRDYKRGLLTP